MMTAARILTLFLAFVIDTTWCPKLSLSGGYPCLTLVAVAVIAMHTTKNRALVFGAATGLVIDLLYRPIIGGNMLLYLYVAWLIWTLYHFLSVQNTVMACCYVFITTLLFQGVIALLPDLFGGSRLLLLGSLIRAAENAVLTAPLYLLEKHLCTGETDSEEAV